MKRESAAPESRPARGRPRAFDTDTALDAALRVFWARGYEGTSLEELTTAMKINRPSLYAAFGNKEQLFRKALDRYCGSASAALAAALAEPTSRAAAERLLRGATAAAAVPGRPRGCLLVQGALTCTAAAEPIRRELAGRRGETETALAKRFAVAVRAGDLRKDADPIALARFITTLLYGLSVQSSAGKSEAELNTVIDAAMRGWPDQVKPRSAPKRATR